MIGVIVAHERDLPILELCIKGIRDNCEDINRIVVISKFCLTPLAEWIDEAKFPFTYEDVSSIVGNTSRTGWYYQQLLKLYALDVLEAEECLIVDADTIFLQPVKFKENSKCLFNFGSEYHIPYFHHISRLLPGLKRKVNVSGICHHIVFKKTILDHMRKKVSFLHKNIPFWKAMLLCVDPKEYLHSGMSEYELYFHYTLEHFPSEYSIRQLKWKNVSKLPDDELFHYVSIHWYLR